MDDEDGLAEQEAIEPRPVKAAAAMRPAFWLAVVGLSQFLRLFLSILSSAILGRLLDPGDFGLIATISPIIALADLFKDLGFTQAVIQRPEITKQQVNALFWLSVAITVVIATVLSLMSPLVAWFFNEPRITHLLIAASWLLLLGNLSALPIGWLNRNLRFTTIAVIECVASVITLATAATIAWFTHSYWALFLGGVASSVTSAVLSLATSGWRPGRPAFDQAVREMARFGAGVSTANFSFFVARNADNFLIAKANGPVALGLYDRAYKLMLVPISQLTWPMSRVLTPMLSRQIDTPDQYRTTYLNSLTCLMLCAQPGLLFCVVFSHPVVQILLGSKWDQVAPIFAWLGVASLQQLATSSIGWLFISQGRGRDYVTLGLTNSAVAVASFVVGLHWGPIGVAASFTLIDAFIRAPLSWWYTTRRGPVSLTDAMTTILPHAVAMAVCAICLWGLGELSIKPTVIDLTLGVVLTYVAYVAVLTLWRSKRKLLNSFLRSGLRRTRGLAARFPGRQQA